MPGTATNTGATGPAGTTPGIVGSTDVWIRTDGNDANDGSANDAAHAFATIQGAWNSVGVHYAASPAFTVNFKLGNAGDYAYAVLGPFSGRMTLTGDTANRTAYRILSGVLNDSVQALLVDNAAYFYLSGVTLVLDDAAAQPAGSWVLKVVGSTVWIDTCQFELTVSSASSVSAIFRLENFSSLSCQGSHDIVGGGFSVGAGMLCYRGDFNGAPPGAATSAWTWNSCHFTTAGHVVINGSLCAIGNMTLTNTSNTGSVFSVQSNGLLYTDGHTLPGSTAGSVGSGGQVF